MEYNKYSARQTTRELYLKEKNIFNPSALYGAHFGTSKQPVRNQLMGQVRVGVGAIILNGDKVLLGERINSHGGNTWCFPGGHFESGETLEECARRETDEEVGIAIDKIYQGPTTNDIFEQEGKHYITIFMLARYAQGEVQLKEPHKFKHWNWFNWNELPSPLFLPIQNLINSGQYERVMSVYQRDILDKQRKK